MVRCHVPRKKKDVKSVFDWENASLEEWLRIVFTAESKQRPVVIDFCFPNDRLSNAYLGEIAKRSEAEVKGLLRKFLISTGSLGSDRSIVNLYLERPELFRQDLQRFEFSKRLIRHPPWEGLTWVLDLLPDNPQEAINVVSAYFVAHVHWLPEGRMHSLSDVENIIRARYLHQSHPQQVISGLSYRDFEFLVASIYKALGFRVKVTTATRDGGCDIKAYRTEAGSKESVLIECKLHVRKLAVKEIRSFVGVVETEKVNRGILIAPNGFTQPGQDFARQARRVELVDYGDLNRLLNQTHGADWPRRIGHIIATQKSQSPASNKP